MEAAATAGSCGDCWKLQRVADKACNMTENALSILIVIFSIQLKQTETSDRKLFIFQNGQVQPAKFATARQLVIVWHTPHMATVRAAP